jgi:hypothetical protein
VATFDSTAPKHPNDIKSVDNRRRYEPSQLSVPVDEVRKMKSSSTNQNKSLFSVGRISLWGWSVVFAGAMLIAIPAAASNAPGRPSSISKIAIEAYCAEAQSESALLADGSVSYKRVADLASERALVEHPSVYPDSSGWKVKIVALLDQYGDEPTSELCTEPHS